MITECHVLYSYTLLNIEFWSTQLFHLNLTIKNFAATVLPFNFKYLAACLVTCLQIFFGKIFWRSTKKYSNSMFLIDARKISEN